MDQYFTFPGVAASLLTSAMKNVDVVTRDAVVAFANNELESGVRMGNVGNNGVGLAPYHDQENNIPERCKVAVTNAEMELAKGGFDTGYNP